MPKSGTRYICILELQLAGMYDKQVNGNNAMIQLGCTATYTDM